MATFLLIDDNYSLLLSMESTIRRAFTGSRVVKAATGEEALTIAPECRPDVIVLDITLPGLDGFQICGRFREIEATATVPILLISGDHTGVESRVTGLEQGGDGYLCKPFTLPEFRAQLRALLRVREAEVALRRQKQELQAAFDEQSRMLRESHEALKRKVLELEQLVEQQVAELTSDGGRR